MIFLYKNYTFKGWKFSKAKENDWIYDIVETSWSTDLIKGSLMFIYQKIWGLNSRKHRLYKLRRKNVIRVF